MMQDKGLRLRLSAVDTVFFHEGQPVAWWRTDKVWG